MQNAELMGKAGRGEGWSYRGHRSGAEQRQFVMVNNQTETARDIVLEGGGDYLLTVKDNQLKLHQNIQKLLPAPKADFPPLEANAHGVSHLPVRKGPQREPLDSDPGSLPGAALLSAGSPGGSLAAPKPGPPG